MSTYEDFPWNMGKPGNTVGKGYEKYGEQQKHGSTWGTWRVAVWLELPGRWGWLVWLVGGEQGFGVMVRLVNLILSMGKHAGFNASQSHCWEEPGTREVEGEKRWERERAKAATQAKGAQWYGYKGSASWVEDTHFAFSVH